MIKYRHFAPRKYKCLYCGYSPLEIWAFVYNVESLRTVVPNAKIYEGKNFQQEGIVK